MTEKYKKLTAAFFVLQVACIIVPISVFFVLGIFNGEVKVASKFFLGLGTVASLVIAVIGLISKMHLRTPMFIFILVCYFCLKHFVPVLIVFAICTLLDEMVFEPLYKHYREKYVINKEIDGRMK